MDNIPEDESIVLLTTHAEMQAVHTAIWHYLRFVKCFKIPSPLQVETVQLLELFQRRYPMQQRKPE
jgi:hypothetical protein